jgi:hypothetical protein
VNQPYKTAATKALVPRVRLQANAYFPLPYHRHFINSFTTSGVVSTAGQVVGVRLATDARFQKTESFKPQMPPSPRRSPGTRA